MGNIVKTAVFLAFIWFTFLFVLPIAVSIVEIELGIQRFPPQLVPATLLLAGGTLLGVWAAFTLAVKGRGTPAPFAPPQQFVVAGPYRYVRHPFVLALLGQGVGVGIALGSIPVLAYVTVMMVIYYYAVRPGEERALEARFGEPVRSYARAVRGFRPRLKPYTLTSSERPGR